MTGGATRSLPRVRESLGGGGTAPPPLNWETLNGRGGDAPPPSRLVPHRRVLLREGRLDMICMCRKEIINHNSFKSSAS